MRSYAARLTWSVSTWIILGVAAFFLLQSEKDISRRRAALGTFDAGVRSTSAALGDVRHTQAAYVATGQNLATWAPRIRSLLHKASESLDALRTMASSADARTILLNARTTLMALEALDGRIREYVRDGQTLMAADIVFSESTETATDVARQVEQAQITEHWALDTAEASTRHQEAYAAGGAAVFAVLMVGLLALMPGKLKRDEGPATQAAQSDVVSPGDLDLSTDGAADARTAPSVAPPRIATTSGAAPVSDVAPASTSAVGATIDAPLKSTADLCSALARARDSVELKHLLGRAAESIDATGVILWLGSTKGGDLRPVLASGFPDDVVVRMPPVSRTADNAVAAAYRTGTLQVVRARPGSLRAAVAAPVFSPAGCIGAFAAEIKDDRDASDQVQAIASLVAVQLVSTLTMLGADQGSTISASAATPSIAAILTTPVSSAGDDLAQAPRTATA
jgi:hypothetical protein